MKIIDLNRHGGIGANSHLIKIGPFKILVDAGLHPKVQGKDAVPVYEKIVNEPIDFIILTHCHLDHLGSLPIASRLFPNTKILLSHPSNAIAKRMLHNSVNVMMKIRDASNAPDFPLYTHSEVARMAKNFLPLTYQKPFYYDKGTEELSITMHSSGHIAGAVALEIIYKQQKIFLSGDVLFRDQRHLAGAQLPRQKVDTLMLETTRGLSSRDGDFNREGEIAKLFKNIANCLSNGGSVLIPTFALGRMQEIMCLLHEAKKKKLIPNVPVFASGLGMELSDYLDEISRKTGLVKFRKALMKDIRVQSLHELHPGKDPNQNAIYVVSSGMLMENTPSYAVAASLLDNHKNLLCFVGYCDPDTPGGKLLESKQGDEFLFGALDHSCTIQAKIERYDLSGHAEREELLDFAKEVDPRSIILTHGDPDARKWFAKQLSDFNPKLKLLDLEPLKEHEV